MRVFWQIYRLIRPFFKFINKDTIRVARYLVAIYERNVNLSGDEKRKKVEDELTEAVAKIVGEKAPRFIIHFLIQLVLFYFRKPED